MDPVNQNNRRTNVFGSEKFPVSLRLNGISMESQWNLNGMGALFFRNFDGSLKFLVWLNIPQSRDRVVHWGWCSLHAKRTQFIKINSTLFSQCHSSSSVAVASPRGESRGPLGDPGAKDLAER